MSEICGLHLSGIILVSIDWLNIRLSDILLNVQLKQNVASLIAFLFVFIFSLNATKISIDLHALNENDGWLN